MRLSVFLDEMRIDESFSMENLYDFYALIYVWRGGRNGDLNPQGKEIAGSEVMPENDWAEFTDFFTNLVYKLKGEYLQKIKTAFDFHEGPGGLSAAGRSKRIDWEKERVGERRTSPNNKRLPNLKRPEDYSNSDLAPWVQWDQIKDYGVKLYRATSVNDIIKAIDDINHLAHNHGRFFEYFSDKKTIHARRPGVKEGYTWMGDLLYDKVASRSFDFMIPNMSMEGREWLYKYCLYAHETDLIKNPTKWLPQGEWERLVKEIKGLGKTDKTRYEQDWLDRKRPENKIMVDLLNIENDNDFQKVQDLIDKLGNYPFQKENENNRFLFDIIDQYEQSNFGITEHKSFYLIRRIKSFFWKKGLKKISDYIRSTKRG